MRSAFWLCERFGDFGKREREPGESLESLVILAERERVPGESLESIERKT